MVEDAKKEVIPESKLVGMFRGTSEQRAREDALSKVQKPSILTSVLNRAVSGLGRILRIGR